MANLEIQESNSRPDRIGAATYASLAASSWNANDMRSLFNQSQPANDITALFGNLDLFAGPTENKNGYIGVYKPGASPVSEKPENKDSAKPWELPVAPETAQRGGVIADNGNQARWQRAQEVHKLGQDESVTDLYGTTKQPAQKFELFDSSAKKEEPAPVVAWDPRKQLDDIQSGFEKVGKQAKKAGAEASAELTKEGAILDKPAHPYKDNPDQLMDYNACKQAWNSFAVFKRHPNLDSSILPAIVRNEASHLRVDDKLLWNPAAEHGYDYKARPETTIGPANMMVTNIRHLVAKYPQLTDPEKGGIDPKHILQDAIKPRQASWLAAAYLADKAEAMEKSGHKTITHHDLIKSYNPDADQKQQAKLIHDELIKIKQHHPLFRDDK